MITYKHYNPENKTPEMGAIIGEYDTFYHSTDAIGNSKLKVFRDRVKKYYLKYVAKTEEPEKEKEHYLFGRAVHCALFEGKEQLEKRFVFTPDGAPGRPAKKRSEYKGKITDSAEEKLAFWEVFLLENKGKCILSAEEKSTLDSIKNSVNENAVAKALLAEGRGEVTFRHDLGWTTIQCRADWFIEHCSASLADLLNDALDLEQGEEFNEGDMICLDGKSTASLTDTDSASFQKQFSDLQYYIQCGLYSEVISTVTGREDVKFLFLAFEKKSPFETAVFRASDESVELGIQELGVDLDNLKQRMKSGNWNTFPQNKILSLDVKPWEANRSRNKVEKSSL